MDTSGSSDVRADGQLPATKPIVYAWFPANMNNWDTSAIDWTNITHLCLRSVVIQSDGTLKPAATTAQIETVTQLAHAKGVKVTILVWGTNAQGSSTYLANHQDKAAQSLLDFVETHNLDGINMDDESWSQTNSVTGGANRDLVTSFFSTLRKKLDAARPGYHLTWAAPPVISAQDKFGAPWWDYAAIVNFVDGLAIMSYCMNPPTIGWTTGAQPVSGGGKVTGHARDFATVIDDYLQAIGGKKDKLLLGIGLDRGGTEWDATTDQALSPIIGAPRKLTAPQALANAATYGRRFHPLQQEPWYRYSKGSTWVQGWYEDQQSLRAKFNLAKSNGLAGVCLWVLDGASEPADTFELFEEYRN